MGAQNIRVSQNRIFAPKSPGTSDHLEASLSADLGVGTQKISVSQNRIFAPKSPGTSDHLEASLSADLGVGAQNMLVISWQKSWATMSP
jgi:hypothetical protein